MRDLLDCEKEDGRAAAMKTDFEVREFAIDTGSNEGASDGQQKKLFPGNNLPFIMLRLDNFSDVKRQRCDRSYSKTWLAILTPNRILDHIRSVLNVAARSSYI